MSGFKAIVLLILLVAFTLGASNTRLDDPAAEAFVEGELQRILAVTEALAS